MIQCPKCSRKFKTQAGFDNHVVTHTSSKEEKNEKTRSYENKPKQIRTESLQMCPVPGCNRKYHTSNTLKSHVEKKHYFDTRFKSQLTKKFTVAMKIRIFTAAAHYFDVIQRNDADEMVHAANNLLPQLNGEEISESKRVRVIAAQETFVKNITCLRLIQRCDWNAVIADFEGFLMLGLPYYDTNFNPSLPIDFLWHATMQDSNLYQELCQNRIPHCAKERSRREDEQRFEYFEALFEHHYRRKLHAPSGVESEKDFMSYAREEQLREDNRLEALEKERTATKEANKLREEMQHLTLEVFCMEREIPLIDWYEYVSYYSKQPLWIKGEELMESVAMQKEKSHRSILASSC